MEMTTLVENALLMNTPIKLSFQVDIKKKNKQTKV